MGFLTRIIEAIVDEAKAIRQISKYDTAQEFVRLQKRNRVQHDMLQDSHRNNAVLRTEVARISRLRLAVKRAGQAEQRKARKPPQMIGNDYY